jgi:eukaryotic-like serine/threonine-protein kinase
VIDRRTFLTSLGACALSRLTMAQSPTSGAAAPHDAWPQFRGAASLTGISASSLPDTLKQVWAWEGGEVIESSAAIVNGNVYVGTGTGELVALSLADGSLRWRYKAGESIGESSPCVANGRAFIGDLDGAVHAVDVSTGKAAWTAKTRSEIKSSPVVTGDLVLIGSYDGGLYGYGAADGKERWIAKTENYVHGTPCIVGGPIAI